MKKLDFSPREAQRVISDWLSLGETESEALLKCLIGNLEDPILAIKLNPAWLAIHGQQAADDVCDGIATWNANGYRRDEDGRRWIFHLEISRDIYSCKAAVMAAHSNAFTFSPAAAQRANVPSIPLAFSAVIHKIGVRQDDVKPFEFFYL